MDYYAPDHLEERIEPHKLRVLAHQLGISIDVVSLRFEQARRAKLAQIDSAETESATDHHHHK